MFKFVGVRCESGVTDGKFTNIFVSTVETRGAIILMQDVNELSLKQREDPKQLEDSICECANEFKLCRRALWIELPFVLENSSPMFEGAELRQPETVFSDNWRFLNEQPFDDDDVIRVLIAGGDWSPISRNRFRRWRVLKDETLRSVLIQGFAAALAWSKFYSTPTASHTSRPDP